MPKLRICFELFKFRYIRLLNSGNESIELFQGYYTKRMGAYSGL